MLGRDFQTNAGLEPGLKLGQPELGAAELGRSISAARREQLVKERSMRMQRVSLKAVSQLHSFVSSDGILFKSDEPSHFGDSKTIEIEGGIYDGPDSIGTWTRTWEQESDGWIVYHNNIDIKPASPGEEGYQGRGIASEWLRSCEQRYLEFGVKEIRLLATGVGGYAWARKGFIWRVPEHSNMEKELDDFKKALEQSINQATSSGEITEAEERFLREKILEHVNDSGVDIAALASLDTPGYSPTLPDVDETQDRAMGRKTGRRERSLGQVLLTDVQWHGSKKLD